MLPLWKIIACSQKNWENKVKIKCLALIWGIAHFCRSNMTKDIVKSMKKLDRKKCKKLQIWNFLKNQFFRILIISKVTFDLEECTIPKIKAKNVSFGPYFVNFWAKLNILWERKQWSCLIFFDPDFILKLASVFHHVPSFGLKQLCALAHLGCVRTAASS